MEAASKGGGDKGYKRSWRNLLINKRYQLRFTLFMVGLSAVLMIGLGVWVMKVANDTTEVSRASIFGVGCPKPVVFVDEKDQADESSKDDDATPDGSSTKIDDPSGGKAIGDAPPPAPSVSPPVVQTPPAPPPPEPTPAPAPAAGAGSDTKVADAKTEEPRPRRNVTMGESKIEMIEAPPRKVAPDFGKLVVGRYTCELRQLNALKRLEIGRMRILYVLILTGLLLVLGLAAYGIKMTHKVAGPLFKVGLYHAKMKSGRFDKVYNLRKGDQLVDFYEHFKTAHGGVVKIEKSDIEQIKAVIAAADAAGVKGEAVDELRELLARKEKSLE
jgi:hypothetical protein